MVLEALGAAATILTLIEALGNTVKTIYAVCRDFQEMPEELTELHCDVELLTNKLRQIAHFNLKYNTTLSNEDRLYCNTLLLAIQRRIQRVKDRYIPYGRQPGKRKRLRLSLVEAKAIRRESAKVQHLHYLASLHYITLVR